MKRLWIVALLGLTVIGTGHAQKTTKNNYTGNWETAASWTGGAAAATTSIGGSDLNLVINGFIKRTGNLTFAANNDNKNFIINDTLVVIGNITFANKAANLRLGPNAVLIVFGDLNADNKIVIENGGIFVVTGDMNFSPSPQDEYDNPGGGELYVGGSVTGNNDAEEGEDNWDDLADDYPGIHDYVMCGGGASCKLPVKIAYFSAKKSGDHVEVRWATILERNFRHFVIQRSSDGLVYEDIAIVNGKGFDLYNVETAYEFIDMTPQLGTNYYRLKAVDYDDSFEYFKPELVRMEGSKKLSVYPNPCTGERIAILLNFHPDESDRICVLDCMGSVLCNVSAIGLNEITFSARLRPGVYFLRYTSRGYEQVDRFVVK